MSLGMILSAYQRCPNLTIGGFQASPRTRACWETSLGKKKEGKF